MEAGIPQATFDTRAQCWLMFSLLSTTSPDPLHQRRLPENLPPECFGAWGGSSPSAGFPASPYETSMKFLPAHLPILLRSLWCVSSPLVLCHHQSSWGVLCAYSSRSLLRILNKTEPSMIPWAVAQLITSLQLNLVPLHHSLGPDIWPVFSPTQCLYIQPIDQ